MTHYIVHLIARVPVHADDQEAAIEVAAARVQAPEGQEWISDSDDAYDANEECEGDECFARVPAAQKEG